MRKLAILFVAMAIFATACDLDNATTPAPHPRPVAIVAVSNGDNNWAAAKCIVGLAATGFGIFTTVGSDGILAALGWGFVGWGAAMTTADCWQAAVTDWEPVTITMTCNGSFIFPVTFQKFVDVENFMQSNTCMPPDAWWRAVGSHLPGFP